MFHNCSAFVQDTIEKNIPTPYFYRETGSVVTMMENGSGNGKGPHDQMTTLLTTSASSISSSSAPASGGANTVTSYSIGSTSSSITTSIANAAASRNVMATSTASNSSNSNVAAGINREQVYTWIQELSSPDTRERVLIELSRKREVLPDLAPMLWHSFGTIAALLQEIVMIYPVINPPNLNVSEPLPLGHSCMLLLM